MRRVGEVILTVAIMTMVAGLALADHLRKRVGGSRLSTEVAGHDNGRPVDAESRAGSIVLHVL